MILLPNFLKPHLSHLFFFFHSPLLQSLNPWPDSFLSSLEFTIFNVHCALYFQQNPGSLEAAETHSPKFFTTLYGHIYKVLAKNTKEPPDIPFVCNSLKKFTFIPLVRINYSSGSGLKGCGRFESTKLSGLFLPFIGISHSTGVSPYPKAVSAENG